MKLISVINANEFALDEQVFRNSSFGSFIAFVIFFGLFLAVVGHYYWYSTNYSIITLGYIGYLWLGFWFGLIAKLVWSRLRSSFLPSNWLLKTSSGRLLIIISFIPKLLLPGHRSSCDRNLLVRCRLGTYDQGDIIQTPF